MKITGGQIKGRTVAAPKGLNIRPSGNKVREAVFNIIGQDLSDSWVLDLFAGTGLLGLEALSRGAAHAVFVDHAKQSLELVEKNLRLCGYEHKGSICKWDLSKGLPKNRPFLESIFDIVFLDPPYKSHLAGSVMEALSVSGRLAPGALLVLETGRNANIVMLSLELLETRIYGDTKLSIFGEKDLS